MGALEVGTMLRGYFLADLALLLPAVAVWFALRFLVRAHLGALPMSARRSGFRHFFVGIVIGVLALAATVLPAVAAGSFEAGPGLEDFEYLIEPWDGVGSAMLLFFLIQSLAEELLFRGILMGLLGLGFFACGLVGLRLLDRRRAQRDFLAARRRLFRVWLGSGLLANLLVTAAFSLVHVGNEGANGLAILNIALVSLVLGQLFWVQSGLFGVWGVHWAWNAGLAVLGLPVSGFAAVAPTLGIGFTAARPDLLSGGEFGPEASICASVVFTVMLVLILVRCARERPSALCVRRCRAGKR